MAIDLVDERYCEWVIFHTVFHVTGNIDYSKFNQVLLANRYNSDTTVKNKHFFQRIKCIMMMKALKNQPSLNKNI